jgi:UDP-glucose-4-epimerase GalE
MRVLVTGGAGYVGSHTVRALTAAGHAPVILDDLSTGHREIAEATGTPFVHGSIADGPLVERVVQDHGCEGLLHFAAKSLVGESVDDPALYLVSNVADSARLFQAVLRAGVRRVIVSSTAATYGEPLSTPITEDAPLSPINAYGASKKMMEEMLAVLEGRGLRWCALRYFNACGAARDGSVGEWHDVETHLIPRLLDAAVAGRPAPVFGVDYPTPDGSAVRDYVHVDDLADAHVRALERLDSVSLGPVNLGTGSGASVLEVVDAVRRVTGHALPVEKLPRRAGDPAILVASNARAREVLGWTPRYSDLDTIVTTAWRWHQRESAGSR